MNSNSKRRQKVDEKIQIQKAAETKKALADIERLIKQIEDKVKVLETSIAKFQNEKSKTKKKALESDINCQFRKLLEYKTQLIKWLNNPDITDKRQLRYYKEIIESKLKGWNLITKDDMHTARQRSHDEIWELEKSRHRTWLKECVDQLKKQIEEWENNGIREPAKKKKPASQDTITVSERIKRHGFHIAELRSILDRIEKDELILDKLKNLKDEVETYVEFNDNPGYIENRDMYKEFHSSTDADDQWDSSDDDGSIKDKALLEKKISSDTQQRSEQSRASESSECDVQSTPKREKRKPRKKTRRSDPNPDSTMPPASAKENTHLSEQSVAVDESECKSETIRPELSANNGDVLNSKPSKITDHDECNAEPSTASVNENRKSRRKTRRSDLNSDSTMSPTHVNGETNPSEQPIEPTTITDYITENMPSFPVEENTNLSEQPTTMDESECKLESATHYLKIRQKPSEENNNSSKSKPSTFADSDECNHQKPSRTSQIPDIPPYMIKHFRKQMRRSESADGQRPFIPQQVCDNIDLRVPPQADEPTPHKNLCKEIPEPKKGIHVSSKTGFDVAGESGETVNNCVVKPVLRDSSLPLTRPIPEHSSTNKSNEKVDKEDDNCSRTATCAEKEQRSALDPELCPEGTRDQQKSYATTVNQGKILYPATNQLVALATNLEDLQVSAVNRENDATISRKKRNARSVQFENLVEVTHQSAVTNQNVKTSDPGRAATAYERNIEVVTQKDGDIELRNQNDDDSDAVADRTVAADSVVANHKSYPATTNIREYDSNVVTNEHENSPSLEMKPANETPETPDVVRVVMEYESENTIAGEQNMIPYPGVDADTRESQTMDGCLRIPREEMEQYINRDISIGEGLFGTVYRGNYKGFDVAIKEQVRNSTVSNTKRQFMNEKGLAFLRSIHVMPVLAYSDDSVFTLMYPLMAKDLKQAFENGGNLTWEERLRVLFHVIEGIKFLHTAIKGVRGEIIHGDIKPGNILLDARNNARLGDAGLAAEIQPDHSHYTTTANVQFGTEGYVDPYDEEDTEGDCDDNDQTNGGTARNKNETDQIGSSNKCHRRRENDIFSFGIVGVQLLKWQPAFTMVKTRGGIRKRKTLFDFLTDSISNDGDLLTAEHLMNCTNPCFVDRDVWRDADLIKSIAEIVVACLQKFRQRHRADEISSKLKKIMTTREVSLFNFTEGKCLHCLSNDAENNEGTLSVCCDSKMFCKVCVDTSFRNPLFCPFHGRIEKHFEVHRESYALLISGIDGEDEETEASFKKDVDDMYAVITDPRIVGIPKENVTRFTDQSKGARIFNSLEDLHGKQPQLLLVYYSGHGDESLSDNSAAAELDVDIDSALNIKVNELQGHLKSIQSSRLLVILDCCFAANYEVLPRFDDDTGVTWQVQLNGASGRGVTEVEDNKSIFTQHLIAALHSARSCPLKRMSEEDVETVPCKYCEKLRKISSFRGYIDLHDVRDYISEHMKSDETTYAPNMSTRNVSGEIKIAHYNDRTFVHTFIFCGNEGKKRAFYLQSMGASVDDLLENLFQMVTDIGLVSKKLGHSVLQLVGYRNAREYEVDDMDLVIRHVVHRGEAMRFRIRRMVQNLDLNKPVVLSCSRTADIDLVTDLVGNLYQDQCNIRKENDRIEEVEIRLSGLSSEEVLKSKEESPFKEGERRTLFQDLTQCLLKAIEVAQHSVDCKKLCLTVGSNYVLVTLRT